MGKKNKIPKKLQNIFAGLAIILATVLMFIFIRWLVDWFSLDNTRIWWAIGFLVVVIILGIIPLSKLIRKFWNGFK